jgi:hypothetical protein
MQRLVGEELYGFAAYISKMWQLPDQGIWEAWATALIRCNSPTTDLFHISSVLITNGRCSPACIVSRPTFDQAREQAHSMIVCSIPQNANRMSCIDCSSPLLGDIEIR